MNHGGLRDEFYGTVKRALDGLHEKYGESASESDSPLGRTLTGLTLRFSAFKALKSLADQAEEELRLARLDYDDAYDRLFRRRTIASEQSRATLPLDIVAYIISLAYDNETSKGYDNGWFPEVGDDFRKQSRSRVGVGARGLTDKLHPAHKVLLSTTRLPISDDTIKSSAGDQIKRVANASLSKFRVVWDPDPIYFKRMFRTVNRYSQQIRSLVVHNRRQLEGCASVLPYLKDFAYLRGMKGTTNPNYEWLRGKVKERAHSNIRFATISSCFLARFMSSGFFENVVSLRILTRCGWPGTSNPHRWPSYSRILELLPRLQGLVSLELDAFTDVYDALDKDKDKQAQYNNVADAPCCVLPALRQLRFTFCDLHFVQFIVPKFSLCDLTEIAFGDVGGSLCGLDVSAFARQLSDMFPHLQKLRIPEAKIREVLMRQISSSSNGDDGHRWNFPQLHTLDIRGAPDYGLDDPKVLVDIVNVIRARAASRCDKSQPGVPGQEVQPINCFCMGFPSPRPVLVYDGSDYGGGDEDEDEGEEDEEDFYDDYYDAYVRDNKDEDEGEEEEEESIARLDDEKLWYMEGCERTILLFELKRLVPNLIWMQRFPSLSLTVR